MVQNFLNNTKKLGDYFPKNSTYLQLATIIKLLKKICIEVTDFIFDFMSYPLAFGNAYGLEKLAFSWNHFLLD